MKKVMELYKEFTSFEGSLFKYSLSFSFLLALAPSLIIIMMLFKFGLLPSDIIQNFIMSFIPYESSTKAIASIFEFFLQRQYNLTSFIITTVVSFYLASRIIFSFLLISASHEDVFVPKWSIRVRSIVLFVEFIIIFVVGIGIATFLKDFLPIVSAGVMLLILTMMYRSLSFRKRNWSFGILGAMFSTLFIMCLAALFITLINHFTSYRDIYGPLASLVVLLLAIYLISCIIYFGFCLNLVFEEDYGFESRLPMKYERYYNICKHIAKFYNDKLTKMKK